MTPISPKLTGAILAILLIAAYVASLLTLGIPGGLLFLVVPMLILVAKSPRRLLLFYWCCALLSPTLEIILPVPGMKQAETLLAIGLIALLFMDIAINGRSNPETGTFRKFVLVFLVILGLSAYANRTPTLPTIHFALSYAKPFFLFLYTIRFFTPKFCRQLIVVFAVSCLVQIAANAAAYIGLNPLPRIFGRVFVDFSVGTLYGCNHVAYFMVAFLILLTVAMKHLRDLPLRYSVLVLSLMALAAAQLFLTFTSHAIILFVPTGILLWAWILLRRESRPASLGLILAVGCAILAFIAYQRTISNMSNTPEMLLRSEEWEKPWYIIKYGFKGLAYKRVFLLSWGFLPHPLLGAGPANFASPLAFNYLRPLAMQYMSDHMLALQWMDRQTASSILGGMHTGMASLWGDLGPFGFITFWGAHIYALLHIWRNVCANKYIDTYQSVLAEASLFIVIFYLLLNTLMDTSMYAHLNVGIWIWLAAVWIPIRETHLGSEAT